MQAKRRIQAPGPVQITRGMSGTKGNECKHVTLMHLARPQSYFRFMWRKWPGAEGCSTKAAEAEILDL